MSRFSLQVELSRDYQIATISRDQGRDRVTFAADDVKAFLLELAVETTQETLQRWYSKARAPIIREVVSYDGAVIEDAGEYIRVKFTAQPKPGVVPHLGDNGFREIETNIFERRSNPQVIFLTQALLSTFYGSAA